MIRDAPSGLRRWREVKRRPVQGNSQNDRILHGPDCNRHKRVYADSFPATPRPQVPGIFPECVWGGKAESIGPMGIKPIPKQGRRTASRWSAPRLRWPHREFTMRFCRRLLFFAERFKNARALEMRLFRQGGIYRSDVSSHLINLVPGSRFTVGSRPGYRTRRKNTPCPSSARVPAGYSLIGLLASIARLRFTGTRRLTCTPPRPREKGHFYFAGKGTFLLCLDTVFMQAGTFCAI